MVFLAAVVLASQTPAVPKTEHRYDFSERDGTEVRDALGGVPGTLGTDVRRLPNGTVRLYGNDRSFVSWGKSLGQFGTADFMVSFHLKGDVQDSLRNVLGNRAAWGHGSFFQVRIKDGILVAEVDGDAQGTGYAAVVAPTRIDDHHWHTVQVVRRGRTLTLEVDSFLVATSESREVANVRNDVPFQAGHVPRKEDDETCFVGEIDNVYVASPIPALPNKDS